MTSTRGSEAYVRPVAGFCLCKPRSVSVRVDDVRTWAAGARYCKYGLALTRWGTASDQGLFAGNPTTHDARKDGMRLATKLCERARAMEPAPHACENPRAAMASPKAFDEE